MYRIAICDDNLAAVDCISDIITKNFGEQYKIYKYDSPIYLEDYINNVLKGQVDILIIDIDLGCDNGIKVAERLKRQYLNIRIIFISGKINYAKDIFEIKPIYFLEKPIDKNKLISAITLAVQDIEEGEKETVSIESKGIILKMDLKKVRYIESNGRTAIFHEGNNKREAYIKLDILEKIIPEKFCRCHNSIIVNLDYVLELSRFQFTLIGGAKISISQHKHKEVKRKFMKYLGDCL